ncbi:unnamed protein product, partial [Ixodes hexagonus]
IGYAFSVDIEDWFYSVPHCELFRAVRECIDGNGAVSFQNTAGVSVEDFLNLLEAYLNSTFISFDNQLYLQKKGICIGSCVALILCNIFLAAIDRTLEQALNNFNVCRVFRYVDDFLIVFRKQTSLTYTDGVNEVLLVFRRHGKGLSFTHELPNQGSLQFLDLNLLFLEEHVCWMYSPRSRKELLPYDAAHSKVVKRGIATLCLESALRKSCAHRLQASFSKQLARLLSAGFPDSVLMSVAETILQKVKGHTARKKTQSALRNVRPEAVPYVHKFSHNLKKVANRHGVPIVFTAPTKLGQLCPRITGESRQKRGCSTKHARPFVGCKTEVVYEIPLTCGKTYVGQTGRCANDRLRKHAQNLKTNDGAHLPAHCRNCKCEPRFSDTVILGGSKGQKARELLEAFFIKKKGDLCVSDTSISLYNAEKRFLDKFL